MDNSPMQQVQKIAKQPAQQQKKPVAKTMPPKAPTALTKKGTPMPPQPQVQGMSAQQVSAILNQALPGIAGALTMKGSQSAAQINTVSGVVLQPLINSLNEINANLGTLAGVAEPLTTWLNAQNAKEGAAAEVPEEDQEGGRRRTRHRRGRRSTRRRR